MRTVLALGLALGVAGLAWAQEPRYGPWPDGPGEDPLAERGSDDLQKMVDELRALVDQAAAARAADFRFIRDLRELVRRYEWPWRERIFYDDFRDGDFTRGVPWTVADGEFWVDSLAGLRSIVDLAPPPVAQPEPPPPPAPAQRPPPGISEEFFRIILQELGGYGGTEQPPPSGPPAQQPGYGGAYGGGYGYGPPPPPPRAEIYTAGVLPNAFAIDLLLSARGEGRAFAFGPYQGPARDSGYRLVYSPDARNRLELRRVFGPAVNVVQFYTGDLDLADGRDHRIEWTRDTDGNMRVLVDGEMLIETFDRGVTGDFDGIALVNEGGDYAVRRIAVYAIPR